MSLPRPEPRVLPSTTMSSMCLVGVRVGVGVRVMVRVRVRVA